MRRHGSVFRSSVRDWQAGVVLACALALAACTAPAPPVAPEASELAALRDEPVTGGRGPALSEDPELATLVAQVGERPGEEGAAARALLTLSLPEIVDGQPADEAPGWQEQGAQEAAGAAPAGAEDLAKKLQNPIAALISVPFQFNWDRGIGPKDSDKLWVNVQPVIPFSLGEDWNLISRTIIPVVYAESPADGIDSEFGIGDVTQSLFFSPKKPVGGWILGAGPVLQIPTGTDDLFRTNQFSIGPSAIVLQQTDGWTYGALVNHLWRVAGDDDYPDVNATFLQPFLSYTWKTGTTLAANTESTYNWTIEEWIVPLNLTLSQLVHLGSQPVQFQIGGRWYADKPEGGPEWGLRFGITFLFPK